MWHRCNKEILSELFNRDGCKFKSLRGETLSGNGLSVTREQMKTIIGAQGRYVLYRIEWLLDDEDGLSLRVLDIAGVM